MRLLHYHFRAGLSHNEFFCGRSSSVVLVFSPRLLSLKINEVRHSHTLENIRKRITDQSNSPEDEYF